MITDFRERIVNGESTKEVSLEAVEHFTDAVLGVINPIKSADVIFAITAIDIIRECLVKSDPSAEELSRALLSLINYDVNSTIMISNPTLLEE